MGFWLGLAGLSKYTAVLYILALILIFIFKKQFKQLLRMNIWAGVLIALALISPVLYWNYENNFASFAYQGDHAFTFDSGILKNLGSSFAMQMVSWGIGPFVISLMAFAALIKNRRQETQNYIAMIFLAVFLVFFIYVSVGEVLLPHWMLIFFILMIPIGYAFYLNRSRYKKTMLISFIISALISFVLLFELAFKILPIEKTASLYEGIYGWENVMTEANVQLNAVGSSKKAIAVMNWTLGSRAKYYNDNINSEVIVIDSRHDQFDIWSPKSHINYDLIVIVEANKKDEHLKHLNCARLTPVRELTNAIKSVPVNQFLYYHCANFFGYVE